MLHGFHLLVCGFWTTHGSLFKVCVRGPLNSIFEITVLLDKDLGVVVIQGALRVTCEIVERSSGSCAFPDLCE